MKPSIEYQINKASEAEISEHLTSCDVNFTPTLSSRVEICDYAKKIMRKAERFEAWVDGVLVGLVAAYCNDKEKHIAYITSASVLKEWTGHGVAACLMSQCTEYAKVSGMRQIKLKVTSDNKPAIRLYEKSGFIAGKVDSPIISMSLYLSNGEMHE